MCSFLCYNIQNRQFSIFAFTTLLHSRNLIRKNRPILFRIHLKGHHPGAHIKILFNILLRHHILGFPNYLLIPIPKHQRSIRYFQSMIRKVSINQATGMKLFRHLLNGIHNLQLILHIQIWFRLIQNHQFRFWN